MEYLMESDFTKAGETMNGLSLLEDVFHYRRFPSTSSLKWMWNLGYPGIIATISMVQFSDFYEM